MDLELGERNGVNRLNLDKQARIGKQEVIHKVELSVFTETYGADICFWQTRLDLPAQEMDQRLRTEPPQGQPTAVGLQLASLSLGIGYPGYCRLPLVRLVTFRSCSTCSVRECSVASTRCKSCAGLAWFATPPGTDSNTWFPLHRSSELQRTDPSPTGASFSLARPKAARFRVPRVPRVCSLALSEVPEEKVSCSGGR